MARICKNGKSWGYNGQYDNPEYIQKQREAKLGPKHPNWKGGKSQGAHTNKGWNPKSIGKRFKSKDFIGDKNPRWEGGKSFEPYGLKFNNELREKIRVRDKSRCQECFRHQDELHTSTGKKYKLIVHHIDYNKQNNDESNLISLCMNCHFQTNFSREDWFNYFKEKMEV